MSAHFPNFMTPSHPLPFFQNIQKQASTFYFNLTYIKFNLGPQMVVSWSWVLIFLILLLISPNLTVWQTPQTASQRLSDEHSCMLDYSSEIQIAWAYLQQQKKIRKKACRHRKINSLSIKMKLTILTNPW